MFKKVPVHSKCPKGVAPHYSHKWGTRDVETERGVKRFTWCDLCGAVSK